MKKIAIVANDIAMPGEKGLSRLHYLAEFFCDNGFEVEILTAKFQHWEKRFRSADDMKRINDLSKCKITFFDENAYTKNIEPKRILSYIVLAKNIKKYLEANTYDLIYALIPDNHLAAVAGKYAKSHNIPFIIDVEDLWPEAMKMVFDKPVISDVLFSYFSVNAKRAYSFADGVVGSSDQYRDEPLKYKVNVPEKTTVYVGNDIADFDRGASQNIASVDKPDGEFWITYAGTLGTSYDIKTLIRAAAIIKSMGIDNVRVVLLGDGPLRSEFEAEADICKANVTFVGYVSHDIMAAYLVKSDVTINSLVSKASQSIVSKIGDYLAAEKPMINTGLNPEFCAKVESDGFGLNVKPENAEALAEVILKLYNDRALCVQMAEKGRKIAEEQFDRPVSYMNIVRMADKLSKKCD